MESGAVYELINSKKKSKKNRDKKVNLKRIWVVSPSIPYEGLGNPIGVFTTEKLAQNFVNRIVDNAKKAHQAQPEYDISETYINPKLLDQIDKEDMRLYKERSCNEPS